jgi:hypothetical protein
MVDTDEGRGQVRESDLAYDLRDAGYGSFD